MPRQPAIPGLRDAMRKKVTRREQVLAEMAEVVPRARFPASISPHHPKAGPKGGRPRRRSRPCCGQSIPGTSRNAVHVARKIFRKRALRLCLSPEMHCQNKALPPDRWKELSLCVPQRGMRQRGGDMWKGPITQSLDPRQRDQSRRKKHAQLATTITNSVPCPAGNEPMQRPASPRHPDASSCGAEYGHDAARRLCQKGQVQPIVGVALFADVETTDGRLLRHDQYP